MPDALLLLLVNVWAIVLPQVEEQLLPPVIVPVSTTVQVYAVPPAVLLSAMLGAPPLHIDAVAGVAVTDGFGFTVITTVAVPVHPLAVPVTV